MKKKAAKIGQQKSNELLVQAHIRAIMPTDCMSRGHQTDQGSKSSWQVRFYLNTERMMGLLQQGMGFDQIDQIVLNEACREQDTIGVRMHTTLTLCSICLIKTFSRQVGPNQLQLVMMPALVTGKGAFLVVSDRKTEHTGLLAPFPPEIEEKDILKTIRESKLFPINLKSQEAQP